MAAIKNIALITTSTRKSRVGPQITSVINDILTGDADASKNTKISIVDMADFNLPVFDEEIMPAMVPDKGNFKNAHSIAWSNEIKKYDGYIFIIPEYNFGLAGGTKNAVDYLYNEWIGKGVLIISYGIFGGTSASESLDKTLKGMKLNVVDTRPALGFHSGVGDDLWLAVAGKLGDDTKKDIIAETPTILKAFGELKDLMDKQVPKDSQK
ncbi:nadph-dependent fmn reductase [Fusarium subglutinans]|uniref:Nadph-dependent fmn reductase n=1 Tax=Gibberella subglutinans TaxID=42677 RepID=A0A8H5P2T2_GIBSU|nr:nadph-dependent fmn reductase [Fusarium subglutinans]KAF5587694.1 nadph-dependent fmn reductase [Fusarium subglutinans]